MFCKRCKTLTRPIKVAESKMERYCPVCHREIVDWFIDDDGNFIFMGYIDIFKRLISEFDEVAEHCKIKNANDVSMFTLERRRKSLDYARRGLVANRNYKFDGLRIQTLSNQIEGESRAIENMRAVDKEEAEEKKKVDDKVKSVYEDNRRKTALISALGRIGSE